MQPCSSRTHWFVQAICLEKRRSSLTGTETRMTGMTVHRRNRGATASTIADPGRPGVRDAGASLRPKGGHASCRGRAPPPIGPGTSRRRLKPYPVSAVAPASDGARDRLTGRIVASDGSLDRSRSTSLCCVGERRGSIEGAFSPTANSLNLLRLLLATAVIFSHAILIGGYGSETLRGQTTLGTVAVYGFFGISGFLIARSADRNKPGRYLWLRSVRILPAFWVAILLTAFFFGVIAWLHNSGSCNLSCYLRGPNGAYDYVLHNWWLRISQPTIANTPKNWVGGFSNASLWTLFYEFLCYLLLVGMAWLGMFRHRATVLLFAVSVQIAVVMITFAPSLNREFNFAHHWDVTAMLGLVPVFLCGSLIYLYREKIPDSGWLALGSALLFALCWAMPASSSHPVYQLTSADVTAFALAYPVLWLGFHLPWHEVGSKNDYSYGVYIYAAPIAQLLAIWGVYRLGYIPYTLLTVVLTIPFAVASWWLIERNALKLRSLSKRKTVDPVKA